MEAMQSTAEFQADQLGRPPEKVEITNWAIRDTFSAWISLLLGAAVVFCIALVGRNLLVGFVGFAAFLFSTWQMWLPLRYEIGPKGIIASALGWRRRIRWSAVGRCEIRRAGLLILPSATPSPAAYIRGIYLRWRSNREELIAAARYYLGTRLID